MSTLLIGIAGGTASGKTTIAEAIELSFSAQEVLIVRLDNYYKDQSHLTLEERESTNYDHPDAFDFDLLYENLQALYRGESIKQPIYDFTIHNRSDKHQILEPCHVVILEGILVFSDERILNLMDIKVFVDTESDLRIIRRLLRDTSVRGRTVEQSIGQYLDTAKPGHDQFIEPSKSRADIIIPYTIHNTVAIEMLIDQIRYTIQKKDQNN